MDIDPIYEYIKYYNTNVQVYYDFEEQRLYDGIELDIFIQKNKEFQLIYPINKDAFIKNKELNEILNNLYKKINVEFDIEKLWMLSIYLYCCIYAKSYALLKPTARDEMEIYNQLDTAYSITITGINEKGEDKEVVFRNRYIMEKILNAIADIDEDSLIEIYEIDQIASLKDISNKTIFDYLYVLELSNFLKTYRKRARLSVLEQQMMLHIMFLLKLYPIPPKTDTYRRLMSDFKKYPIRESINTYTDKDGNTFTFVLTFIKWKDWTKL